MAIKFRREGWGQTWTSWVETWCWSGGEVHKRQSRRQNLGGCACFGGAGGARRVRKEDREEESRGEWTMFITEESVSRRRRQSTVSTFSVRWKKIKFRRYPWLKVPAWRGKEHFHQEVFLNPPALSGHLPSEHLENWFFLARTIERCLKYIG